MASFTRLFPTLLTWDLHPFKYSPSKPAHPGVEPEMIARFRSSMPPAYTKLEKEDPEDIAHQRAQFLIYKVLERADSGSRPWCCRIRLRRLKIRLGKRFKRLKKSLLHPLSSARNLLYKHLFLQRTSGKRLFN